MRVGIQSSYLPSVSIDQFAVRNVTGTLRAIITGLSYLATFLFAANAVGLTGLGVQTLLAAGEAGKPKDEGDAADKSAD